MAPVGDDRWTIETLKTYFEAVLAERDRAVLAAFAAQKSAVDAALAAADRAVAKAEVAAEKRFESVNEFRAQLKDQQTGLISRDEAIALFRAMQEKVDAIVRAQSDMMPRAESHARHQATQEKLEALQHRIDRNEGRSGGLQAGWGYLVGAVGLFLTLLIIGGILFTLSR